MEEAPLLDVHYLGTPGLIAAGLLETADGLVLVDAGPAVALPALEQALAAAGAAPADVRALLLTHIHLDHAGAAGSFVRRHAGVQVYVHRLGAEHLARPERLLASARRLYGDAMDTLWGPLLPVPPANLHALDGGETLRLGGRTLAVAYTPGHAVHHVSYLDEATGTAYVGDTAGMRRRGVDFVLPVTPPPDVDVAAWRASLQGLRAWRPARLFLTHFGPSADVPRHLDEMERRLGDWAEAVRRSLDAPGDDAARAATFEAAALAELRPDLPPADRAAYERFGQPRASWHGLARYWRKHAA